MSTFNPSPTMSQLSARLLASRVVSTVGTSATTNTSGYSSSGSERGSNYRQTDSTGAARESSSVGSSKGYAADQSSHPSLPSNINCTSSDNAKRMNSTDDASDTVFQPALKRMRTQYNTAEMNYLASTTRVILEQDGSGSYPKLQLDRPRMFPPKSGVNMSTVSHTYSSECTSPFLVDSKMNNYMECSYQLTALMQSTLSYYRLDALEQSKVLPESFMKVVELIQQSRTPTHPVTIATNNFEKEAFSDSEGSASSVTISDNGACSQPGNKSSDVSTNSKDHRNDSSTINKDNMNTKTPLTAIISIGDALSISRRPRIIALAQEPHNVVQVNAAFLRLLQKSNSRDSNKSSSSSSKVVNNNFLGKPLQELVTLENGFESDCALSFLAGLKSSYRTEQKVSISGSTDGTNTCGYGKNTIQRVSIIPVGVPNKKESDINTASITHFAIKFTVQKQQQRLSSALQQHRHNILPSDATSTMSSSSSVSSGSNNINDSSVSVSSSSRSSPDNSSNAINVMG